MGKLLSVNGHCIAFTLQGLQINHAQDFHLRICSSISFQTWLPICLEYSRGATYYEKPVSGNEFAMLDGFVTQQSSTRRETFEELLLE